MPDELTACRKCKHFRDNREFQVDEGLVGALCASKDINHVMFDMIDGLFNSSTRLQACFTYNREGKCPHFERGYPTKPDIDKMRIALIDIVNLTGGHGLSDDALGKINRIAHDALGNRSLIIAEDLMRHRRHQGTNPA